MATRDLLDINALAWQPQAWGRGHSYHTKYAAQNVTGSAKRGLIAFSIVCIWPSIVWHESMVPTWNLDTLHSEHGSIP